MPLSEAQTNAGNRQGAMANRGGGRRRGGGGANREHQPVHIVYVLPANAAADAKLQPVQIKTGITDSISTEVLDGLKEGDQVVTSVTISQNSQQPSPQNGGRMFRRF
jgi:HlyD family secretion protein